MAVSIDDLAGINFADIYWDPQLPPQVVMDELLKMTPKEPELRAASLVLYTVRHAARLAGITPDEVLAYVLSPEGTLKVWRDFATHWNGYLVSGRVDQEVDILNRIPGMACKQDVYIGNIHNAQTYVLEMFERLKEPAFRQRAVDMYNRAGGVPVYETARTTSPIVTPSSSNV